MGDWIERCPHGCGELLNVRYDTDGNGGIVRTVDPCSCQAPAALRMTGEIEKLRCRQCLRWWWRKIKRGRKPLTCPRCRRSG